MNITVEISGPVMGDIRIARETPDGRAFLDGSDRDAEEAAQMLERIAEELRRMHPRPAQQPLTYPYGPNGPFGPNVVPVAQPSITVAATKGTLHNQQETS